MDNKLALKIYNVMCATSGLEKDLTVGKGPSAYSAVGEKTVLNMIKPLFKAEKLIMFPTKTIAKEITETYPDQYDAKKTRLKSITQLVITFTIVDVETGESVDIEVAGSGFDSLDKGTGKATTYAFKTAMQKTFMLFSGEDTDNHHSDDATQKAPTTKPTNIDCNDLITVGYKKGFDAKAIEKSLVKNYKHGMEFITQAEHDKTLKTLTALPEKSVAK